MGKEKGSLMEAIWKDYITQGKKVGILLIDEQTAFPDDPNVVVQPPLAMKNLRYQQTLLAYAQYLACPIWCIENNPTIGSKDPKPNRPTTIRLRGLLPPNTPCITKPFFNAFEGTDLEHELLTKQVKAVVVLGYETNFCVMFTAIGGSRTKDGKAAFVDGAVQRGWPVLTHGNILNGWKEAIWQEEKGVHFYAQL